MKKTFKDLRVSGILILVMALFLACDEEFNSIESDVLGKNNANFNTNTLDYPIVAYNKKLAALKINDLSSNLLGVFNDPAYGQTAASVITQVIPASTSPNFGTNPVIDSVVLNIPYYSKEVGFETGTSNAIYSIKDSVYGSDPVKLTIYRSNYFLRDFDPNSQFNDPQNYYSNASSSVNSVLDGTSTVNFDDHILATLKDTVFTPSSAPIITTTGTGADSVNERSAPAFRTLLDNSYWKTVILDQENSPFLSSANNFKDYFRGLYFKTEAVNGSGSMMLLNFANANITIYYSKDSAVSGERDQDTYVLNFVSNSTSVIRLNTFINNFNITLADGDKNLGDNKLYLKGTEGSMAVVDLFGGMVDCNGTLETALDCFKKTYRKLDDNGNYLPKENGNYPIKRLINEANLVIYEDETMATGGDSDFHKYDRIYAYDIKNNIPTIDYALFDETEDTSNPLFSKFQSLGVRSKDENDNFRYKIRLTEHLNNILLKDSTNTKLGLVLSTNVNVTRTVNILDSQDEVTQVPSTALLAPRGTILYGSNVAAPNESKKMRLEIFFTEPNL